MWHDENKLGKKFHEMTEKSRQLLGQTLHLQDARRKYQSQIKICGIKPCSILCNMNMETINMMMMDVARQDVYNPKICGDCTINERRLECLSRVYDISRIKKKGTTFVLTGKMPEERDWMQLNFDITDGETPLHMSVRQNDKVTVFNNMKNNEWCYEEREHWFPFKRGHMYTFTFHMQNNGTMISVNDEFFYYFKHRMNIEKITRIRTDLEYELNSCCVLERDPPKLTVSRSSRPITKEIAIAQTLEDLMTDDEDDGDDDDDGIEDSFEMIDDESEADENFKSLEPNGETLIEKQKLQDSNEILQEVSKLVKKYGSLLVEKQFKALTLRENNLAGRCDQPLMEHKLPNPKKHFQVYITELENGFEPGSIFVFSCVIDTGCCIILRKSENDTYSETEFSFEPSHNQVIMTKYGEIKMKCTIQDITLFSGEETQITIKRLEKGFQVYVNKASCEFFEEEPDLSNFNMIEIRSHGLSNVSYFTKKYNKPQDTLQKLTCINRSCSLKYIPKKGKSFVLTGKMPVHRDWMHINFDISDKDIAVHMSIRQNEKVVVFNNKKNNKWCSEERMYSFPFIRGQTYTFSFDIQLEGTQITVDGSRFYYFKHRMDPEKITRLRSDLEEHHDFCYTVGDTVEQMETLPINIPTK